MGELGEEVQRVEDAEGVLEVVRVFGAKQGPVLERFVTDLLQRDRLTRDVFGEVDLGFAVEASQPGSPTSSRSVFWA